MQPKFISQSQIGIPLKCLKSLSFGRNIGWLLINGKPWARYLHSMKKCVLRNHYQMIYSFIRPNHFVYFWKKLSSHDQCAWDETSTDCTVFNNYSLDKHRHQMWKHFDIWALKVEITNWPWILPQTATKILKSALDFSWWISFEKKIKTISKGISNSKCDVGIWILSKSLMTRPHLICISLKQS